MKRLAWLSVVVIASAAHASWPTDPSSPLVLGEVPGIGADHVAVTTPDGATWIAWIDGQCFASLLVQRIDVDGTLLVPGGLALDTRDDCLLLLPRMAACSDGSVVVSGVGGDLLDTPVHRLASDGTMLWTADVVASDGYAAGVEQFLGLPPGDALVAGRDGTTIVVGRYAVDGTSVWDGPAMIPTQTGSNKRVFGLQPDGADSAYVAWDEPGAYTRRIYMSRIDADGDPAWDEPLQVIPAIPGSSRHTDPLIIADGNGSVVLVWTLGREDPFTTAPLLMQRINADGSLDFESEGRLISLDVSRQFDPVVLQREPGGDLLVAWRDGVLDDQTLRVQRITLAGVRLWGDAGIEVTQIEWGLSHFDASWIADDTVALAVTDEPESPQDPRVNVHRVTTEGTVAGEPWSISGATPAGVVRATALDDAVAVSWFRDEPGFPDTIVAHRVNADGTIGLPPQFGDLDGDGTVGLTDLLALLAQWGRCAAPCSADLDDDGSVGLGDLLILLAQWS